MSNLSTTTTAATTDLHTVDDSARPILGFPLGTALLVLVIFFISGIVSCCYHYEKIRSLRRSVDSNNAAAGPAAEPQDDAAATTATAKSTPFHQLFKEQESETLPVLMPGDEFPKFVCVALREAHHHHQDGGDADENAPCLVAASSSAVLSLSH